MADLFWIGGTGNWSDTAHWATTSGGLGPHAAPTAADNANFDVLSNLTAYTVTLDVSGTCLSFLWANPASGAPAFAGSSTLSIAASMTLVSGMGWTNTSVITFSATTTGKTITTAGVTLANSLTFSGNGGGWTLQDALTSGNTNTLTQTRGTFNSNAKTITIGLITISSANVRTTILDGSTINLTGFNNTLGTPIGVWSASTATNLTFSATGATFNLLGRNAQFTSGGLSYPTVTFSGGDANSITGVPTFVNLTYTGANAGGQNNDILTSVSNFAITGLLTMNGFSQASRAKLGAGVIGTNITITAAAVSFSNVDFGNITAAGASAPWTGTSMGDIGGNTGITFDAPRTLFWVGNGGAVSSSAHYSLSSGGAGGQPIALAQDTIKFDANSFTLASQTINGDEPRYSAWDFTGVLNSPTFDQTNGATGVFYGDLTLAASLTITATQNLGLTKQFGTQTLTSNGATFGALLQIISPNGTTQIADNLVAASFQVQRGTFNDNGHAISAGVFIGNTSNTKVINKSGVWTITGTGSTGTVWNFAATGMTYNDTGSIVVNASGAVTGIRTFAGAGLTYGPLTYQDGDGTFGLTITGADTFTKITAPLGGKITLPGSTTTTISNPSGMFGNGANVLTIVASAGSATLSFGGVMNGNYLNLTNIPAAGTVPAFAGPNSTDGGGNTNWLFYANPAAGGGASKMGLGMSIGMTRI